MSWMAHFSSGMFHPRYLHLPRSPFALQKFQHKIWCGSRKISLTLSLSGNWPVHSSRLSLSHSHPKRESMSKSPWWHDVRTCRRTKFSRKSHFRALWICPPLSSLALAKQVEAAGEEYIMSRKHFPDLQDLVLASEENVAVLGLCMHGLAFRALTKDDAPPER